MPITVALCDGDRPICSTDVDHPENGNVPVSKHSSIDTNEKKKSKLRKNSSNEKTNHAPILIQITDNPTSSVQHTYSFAENNPTTPVTVPKRISVKINRYFVFFFVI